MCEIALARRGKEGYSPTGSSDTTYLGPVESGVRLLKPGRGVELPLKRTDFVLGVTAHQCEHGVKACLPAFLVSLLVLGGCVSAPKYPENWAPGFPPQKLFSKGAKTCPSIAGSYSDTGESSPNENGHATAALWRMLFGGTAIQESVTIHDAPGDVIEIVGWENGKPSAKKKLGLIEPRVEGCGKSDGDKLAGCFQCLNGVTQVMVTPTDDCLPAAACAHDNLLYRGEDGWLVLKRNEFKYYQAVILPLWSTWRTRWYRFRPMPSTTETK